MPDPITSRVTLPAVRLRLHKPPEPCCDVVLERLDKENYKCPKCGGSLQGSTQFVEGVVHDLGPKSS